MDKSMESVFNPRSVAVIGASEVAGKAAERRTRSLLEGGYDGDVYLINPKRSELFGRKAYPNITEVGAQVDLAMIVIAPRFLVSAVADSVKMGVKGIIIITAGLGETGEEGKRFILAEALNMPLQLGPITQAPDLAASLSISASIFLPSSPVSPRPAVMIMTPLTPIFTQSATAETKNREGMTIMARSTCAPTSVILG